LKRQLKDKERRALARQILEAKEHGQPLPQTIEDELIDRYEELLGFVKENRDTVGYVVGADKQREKDDAAAAAAAENEDEGGEIGRSRTTRGVKGMLKN
jgi:hypothetical protein